MFHRILGAAAACLTLQTATHAQKAWLNIARPPEQAICFTLYTVQDNTLKLTAQLYPLEDGVGRDAHLQVKQDGTWRTVTTVAVDEEPYGDPLPDQRQWTARFRVEDWDHTRDWSFRVLAADDRAQYEGRIRRDPIDKPEIVVASLSCNSHANHGPRPDIVRNLTHQDPDLLFFAGDQVYDHTKHLQSWLAFGRQFGELTRDRPTVCIPDDHDVGQPNLWGEGGVKSDRKSGDDGGFTRSAQYVNSVQRAQTWHLPDPYDPTPIAQDISVYYTALRIGRVSFAIIEDRKFKTGPLGAIAALKDKPGRPDLIESPMDPQRFDVPEARLLGTRQLDFLHEWGQDWSHVEMKAVLSQTVFAFAGPLNGPWIGPGGKRGSFKDSEGQPTYMDFDSNGWPQTGRRRALEEIRRAYAVMLCGDQHLATVIHHGINDFRDAGVSFASPAIQNVWVRRWVPMTEPVSSTDPNDPGLGDFFDGFGNKLSMLAYANATTEDKGRFPDGWGAFAEGYAIVRFDTDTRDMIFECWPRGVDVTKPDAPQYDGWPMTVTQDQQYPRQPAAHLPEIRVIGLDEPVVQVVNERTGEIAYTRRFETPSLRLGTFIAGPYTVRIGDQPGTMRELRGLNATIEPTDDVRTIDLTEPE